MEAVSPLNVDQIRDDFPVLKREIRNGVSVAYLDSAATSQKPVQVISAIDDFYRNHNANIHRGIHTLAEEATAIYELSREKVANFINAKSAKEIIFTRNATESINLVAQSWGRANLKSGDLVLLTEMEHHSNIVPWQILAEQLDLNLEFIPVTENGLLNLETFRSLLEKEPKIVGFVHMSNVLGTINPAQKIIDDAHRAGATVVVDAAQSTPHFPVDVQELNADFLAFSSHKMCGPTGVGVLYGKEDHLSAMPPFLGGGDMIKRVSLHSFTTNELPHKFEAGTPAIAEAVGLGSAIDYLSAIGMGNISAHEHLIIDYALERLSEVPGVWVLGPEAKFRGGVASFTFQGVHPHDVSQILDHYGVAIRAGHHCAMPLHEKYCIPASARASFYLYNTFDEVDRLIEGIYKVKEIFA